MNRILVLCFMLISCTHVSEVDKHAILENSKFFTRMSSEIENHFFQISPQIDEFRKELNVIITTPVGSRSLFDYDVPNATRYKKKDFCRKKNNKVSYISNFSLGFVPNLYDQINAPTKIVVFGGDNTIGKNYINNTFRVRVVGSFLESFCPTNKCNSSQYRLVLVSVFLGDKKFKSVKEINDLQNVTDWSFFKEFYNKEILRDSVGENLLLNGTQKTFSILRDNTKWLEKSEVQNLYSSCKSLYNYMWSRLDPIENKNDYGRNLSILLLKFKKQYSLCEKSFASYHLLKGTDSKVYFTYLSALNFLFNNGWRYNCNVEKWEVSDDNRYFFECSKSITISALNSSFKIISENRLSLKVLKDNDFVSLIREDTRYPRCNNSNDDKQFIFDQKIKVD